jgi:hypothetical protein
MISRLMNQSIKIYSDEKKNYYALTSCHAKCKSTAELAHLRVFSFYHCLFVCFFCLFSSYIVPVSREAMRELSTVIFQVIFLRCMIRLHSVLSLYSEYSMIQMILTSFFIDIFTDFLIKSSTT